MNAKARNDLLRSMLRGAILLTLTALIGGGLVVTVYSLTADRIAANEREALLRSLNELVPPELHDNDLLQDVIQVDAPDLLGSPTPLPAYRAHRKGQVTAIILTAIAPNGYSGGIKLLIAIHHDGELGGVRIVHHQETPGLGDKIDLSRSDWVLSFDGKSLGNPTDSHWKVRKDGGDFDQFTGATITPRAVVHAVYNALKLFREEQQDWFKPLPVETEADTDAAEKSHPVNTHPVAATPTQTPSGDKQHG
jgi:electron transport complex protein RnfG